MRERGWGVSVIVAVGMAVTVAAQGQQAPSGLTGNQRAQAKRMLSSIQAAIKRTYYDPAFHGLDLDAHFKAAAAKIDEAQSFSHAYGIIAQALVDFDDSHTIFIPPGRTTDVEYGWQMQLVGDRCFVTSVTPGSDAAAKGLGRGDQVLQIDQFPLDRRDFWKLQYLLYTLSPRRQLQVTVMTPQGVRRQLDIASKVTPLPKVTRVDLDSLETMLYQAAREVREARNKFTRDGDVAIWKLSGFDFDPADVSRTMTKGLEGATSLVLDLRGNGGGLIKTLEEVAGRLFDRDIVVGEMKQRKSSERMVIKKRKPHFDGKLIVLIDAGSQSAAEILARLVQIEKRGQVIGDVSAGAVMRAQLFTDGIQAAQGFLIYQAMITDADLVMTDGKSLERVGVAPDERLLLTAADIAEGRDPVLSRAVMALGGTLTPEAAGKLTWQ